MKFARRTEGIKSARAIFKRAREDVRSKYQVCDLDDLKKKKRSSSLWHSSLRRFLHSYQKNKIRTLQVFVAAALMEYYCSKDKNIAFRIFELGLKKFSNCPEYVICYIDYLSHLNGKHSMPIFSANEYGTFNPLSLFCFCFLFSFLIEDNNTKVLFERILSSGGLEPGQSV